MARPLAVAAAVLAVAGLAGHREWRHEGDSCGSWGAPWARLGAASQRHPTTVSARAVVVVVVTSRQRAGHGGEAVADAMG